MVESYDLGRMLEEIAEDEKTNVSRGSRVTRDEPEAGMIENRETYALRGFRRHPPAGEPWTDDPGAPGQLRDVSEMLLQEGVEAGISRVEAAGSPGAPGLDDCSEAQGIRGADAIEFEASRKPEPKPAVISGELPSDGGGGGRVMSLCDLLEDSFFRESTDILIGEGFPPAMKTLGVLRRSTLPAFTSAQCAACAKGLMTEGQWERFLEKKELVFSIDLEDVGRFRVSAYRQRNTVSMVLRHIAGTIPTLDRLGLPRWIEEIALKPKGLILVTSPPGHGKTTTAASLIDTVNRKKECHIITVEYPIEYVVRPEKSMISQREVGTDTASFFEGIRGVSKQAPDVVMIGELRDPGTIEAALEAVCSGCLVVAAMASSTVASAIESMVNRFPVQLQTDVRQRISEKLLLVFSQRLVPGKGAERVVVAYERLLNSSKIRNLIVENRLREVTTQVRRGSADYESIDLCLSSLVREGRIDLEDALRFADNSEFLASSSGW